MPKREDNVKIHGVLKSVTSQTVQYKPFGYELDFTGEHGGDLVTVELEVPKDSVQDSEDGYILNMDGFKAILVNMAVVLDTVEREYSKKLTGG